MFLRSLEQFISTVQTIFETECFFNMFLEVSQIISIIIQMNSKRKKMEFRNLQEKLEKYVLQIKKGFETKL